MHFATALGVACVNAIRLCYCLHAGPAHPFSKDGLAAGMRNHRAGHVEVGHSLQPCHVCLGALDMAACKTLPLAAKQQRLQKCMSGSSCLPVS